MKISGTNKALVELIHLLDPSFKCDCDPNVNRFRCESKHAPDCLFEEELPKEYGTYIRNYHVEYDGRRITRVVYLSTKLPNGNILDGCVL